MRAKTIIILKNNLEGKGYKAIGNVQGRLYMLVLYLKEECWHSTSFSKEWLHDQDPFNEFCGGNYYNLRKVEGMIVVNDDYYEGDIRPRFIEEGLPSDPHVFITTPEEMYSILLQWQKILEMNPRPNYVIFTEENGIVTITPHNTLEP
ncbi:MAG TPA: hypothetical protein VHA52_09185 [Candidatus Babeliaceae bacterium]|nr:hypothetical protein [Candidatus Babeliaceae bacterium]